MIRTFKVLHYSKSGINISIRILLPFVLLILLACKNEQLNSEKDILSFRIDGQINTSEIDPENALIEITVSQTIELSEVRPEIEVSPGASIFPASETSVDFSNGKVNYVVTAEDKSTKDWSVSVSSEKNDEAEILSFYLSRQKDEAEITDSTVLIAVKLGTDLTSLKPEIEISSGASVTPESGEAVDFTNGTIEYIVTAENGDEKVWLVTVEQEKIYDADILTFSIPGQIGESIFDDATIEVMMPSGTDFSALTPEITISEGTTIEPQSGQTVDFSENGYVDYVITTETGSKKVWRVYVMEEMIKADNEYFNFVGRWDFSDSLKPKAYAPGAYINFNFKGTSCQILVNDQEKYGTYHNYLEIVVDGTEFYRIQNTSQNNTIDVVSGLSDGEHSVTICKNTESNIGYIEFLGVRCDELLPFVDETTYKIECIGNSITCGTGSDLTEVDCGANEWYDQHNAYFSYGPVTARRFNAQWQLTSYSGIGVIQSCCDITFQISDIYDKITLTPGGDDWDFTRYVADLVTICLGQNDGIQDSTTFCSSYIDLINTIRDKYENAYILCLTSPMADQTLAASQKNYLTGIVDYMSSNGDDKVYKYFFSESYNSGCDTHPDLDEHKLIADELEAFITSAFGW